jgi:transcriptional regulator with XRE-family HTH domain
VSLAAQASQGDRFARALTSLRESHGMSIRQLAAASDISVAQISALERPWHTGKTDLRVRRQTVLKLADGLGLSDEERAEFMAAAGHEEAAPTWAQSADVAAAREIFRLTRHGAGFETEPTPAGPTIREVPATAARGADIADVAIGLFDAAIRRPPKPEEVLITFLGPGPSVLDAGPGLRRQWDTAIAALLDNGIRVTHVWGLPDRDLDKAVGLARNVLAYADRSESYEPRVIRAGAAERVRGIPDLIVVPGHGAVVVLIPGSQALVLKDTNQRSVALLAAQTVKLASEIVFQVFKADLAGVLAFEEKFSEYETEIRGDRRLLKGVPTSLWIHPDTEARVAERSGLSGQALARHVAATRARFEAFEDQISQSAHRELIPRRSVEDFALRREPLRDMVWNIDHTSGPGYEVNEVVDALGLVIDRLNRFPDTYKLALSDDPEPGLATAFWEVKQAANGSRAAVLLEIWKADSGHRAPGLIIDEPALARGFSSWFDGLWNQVPETWRNREHLVRWLKELQHKAAKT